LTRLYWRIKGEKSTFFLHFPEQGREGLELDSAFHKAAIGALQSLRMSTAEFTQASIADIAEDKLVEPLFADPLWSTEFFQLAGMPRAMLNRQRVPLDTAPGNFKGDIDV